MVGPTRKDPSGRFFLDKKGQYVNMKGYVVNSASGDVVNNMDAKVMFSNASVDEKTGELPDPFFWDKYNFNPQAMYGDFDY